MKQLDLQQALAKMKSDFHQMDWDTYEMNHKGAEHQIHGWPGQDDEEIMVALYQYSARSHIFHRHDYFYFNYCYRGVHEYITYNNNRIVMRENDIYAGQPFVSHSHVPQEDNDAVLVCIFIKPELVFRTLLPYISTSGSMTNFLIKPSTDRFSEESMHFNLINDDTIRNLLEIMIIEYANKTENTQAILCSLASAFIMQMARKYVSMKEESPRKNIAAQMIQYVSNHLDNVTLKNLAGAFSYHPNYVSSLLKKELGKSFSEILLESRMERAAVLLKGTNLSIEQISSMLGYSSPSNFHKAFREYYNKPPREYTNSNK